MTAPFTTWTVQPHGELTPLGPDIWTVVGEIRMPLGEFPRRMTVVRLTDGGLAIFSAIALDEDEMQALEAFGTPAWLIVPSDRHRLDAPAWKARYPAIRVVAPSGAREKVAQAVAVDAAIADFADPRARLLEVPGTHGHEAALEIAGADGVTLVVNEIIGNIHGEHGLKGWLLRKMGFAGDGPQVPAPVKLQLADGRQALAAQLRQWADLPGLRRIVPSHGDVVEHDPQGVLRRLAAELD